MMSYGHHCSLHEYQRAVKLILMHPFVSLSTVEVLLSCVHYTVIVSSLTMLCQILWTFFSIYRDKQSKEIDDSDTSTVESD